MKDCLSNIVMFLKVRVQICSSVSLNCSQDGGKIGVKTKDRHFKTNAGPHHNFTLCSKSNCKFYTAEINPCFVYFKKLYNF